MVFLVALNKKADAGLKRYIGLKLVKFAQAFRDKVRTCPAQKHNSAELLYKILAVRGPRA